MGQHSARPTLAIIIVEKIGLRTIANGPRVTSSVRSVGSTPMRHERDIASWTTNVASVARTTIARPIHVVSRRGRPTNGAPRPSAKDTTNERPALRSSALAPRRRPTSPELPVVRSCTIVRSTNATKT